MYSEEFIERFWARVDKRPEGCWLWTGRDNGLGYGRVRVNHTKEVVHRISLKLHLGRNILDGMDVAHQPLICHNRLCVNPAHLREATRSENCLDKKIDQTEVNTKGNANGRSKLTIDQVLLIRDEEGSASSIAAKYNISKSQVSKIKSRESWAHIN